MYVKDQYTEYTHVINTLTSAKLLLLVLNKRNTLLLLPNKLQMFSIYQLNFKKYMK